MSFQVNKFIIVPTATYHPPAQRHYAVDARNRGNIENLTDTITEGGTKLNPTAMTRLASNILIPSATTGEVYVPNSFSDRRFRFLLEIQHDDGTIQYLSGYTDRMDEANGHLPDDLELFFNTSSTVRNTRVSNQNGTRIAKQVLDSSEILSAPNMNPVAAMGGIADPAMNSAVTLRPSDIFALTEAKTVADEMTEWSRRQGDANISPPKIVNSAAVPAMFASGIRKSKATNVNAGRYLSDTLGAYVAAQSSPSDNSFFSVTDEALSQLNEATVNTDRFMNPLNDIGARLANGSSITWGILRSKAPEIIQMAMTSINHSRKAAVPQGLNGEYLTGNTRTAIATTKILNGLTGIMSDRLVTRITFTARSGVATGFGGPIDIPTGASVNNAFVDVQNFQSFNQDQSVHAAKTLAGSILHEILANVSSQFTEDVTFVIDYDMLGDTTVNIGFGDNQPTYYVNPQWCSAKSSLVIAPNSQALNDLTSDFTGMFKAVTPREGTFTPAGAATGYRY